MRIFIGMPVHTSLGAHPYAAASCVVDHGVTNAELTFRARAATLVKNFNNLWAEALAGRYNIFAMLHADIVPCKGWLKALIDILRERDADVVSALSPIKNDAGQFSAGIGDPSNPWAPLFRFTAQQVQNYPETFSAADLGFPEYPLLINTGCWVADITKDWAWQRDDTGALNFHFDAPTRIHYDVATGQVRPQIESEDWFVGRLLHEAGAKVLVTKTVPLIHYGTRSWDSTAIWGQPHDELLERPHVQAAFAAAQAAANGSPGSQEDGTAPMIEGTLESQEILA